MDEEVRSRIRKQAGDRCGYCLAPQRLVLGWLEIEHIVPQAQGGSDEEANLWLACRLCNNYKNAQVKGIDPESGPVASHCSIPVAKGGPIILPGAKTVLVSSDERHADELPSFACNSIVSLR